MIILLVILSITILLNSNISTTSSFTATKEDVMNSNLTLSYNTGIYLIKAVNFNPNGLNNIVLPKIDSDLK